MIDNILFSIAGKKRNTEIDLILEGLYNQESIPPTDKRALEYVRKVAEEGSYPDKKYFADQGYEPIRTTKSISELKVYAKAIADGWNYEALRSGVISVLNDSNTFSDLSEKIQALSDNRPKDSSSLDAYDVELEDETNVQKVEGIKTNIDEIDQLTGGIQPGTLATIAAFTSHGKSTLVVSMIYKNIKLGKAGAAFSLEIAPSLLRKQLYSRFLYEEKGIEITTLEMADPNLDDKKKEQLAQHRQEFNDFLRGKLFIVDEAVLNKANLSSFRELSRLYHEIEDKLESLDFITYDHINQVELMFPDMGNRFIRTITSTTKTYQNKRGALPATIMAMQTNREGHKRASKRAGKYDLAALSELNEGERSSYYVIFMFTSDESKLLQETKICMPKHRLGALLTEPVTVTFNPASFVVGETVETVSFTGNLSFLDDTTDYSADDFNDFE